jgi:hypothetical protein
MRRSALLAAALLSAVSFVCAGATQPQTIAPAASPLEIHISGPRQIHRDFPVPMKVTFTNRSAAPLALRFPLFFNDSTRLNWSVTDGAGHELPPPMQTERLLVCPVTGPLLDWNISVLEPGETMEYEFAGDPSDGVVFSGKGFYRISLHYVLTPTTYATVWPFRPANEKAGKYTPAQKVEMIKNASRLEATSNEWVVFLTD